MATKINVRSPFYLNLDEPTIPLPTFLCGTAEVENLSIDQQGQISTPTLRFGIVDSITSTDGDFSNGKYATVSTATIRNLTLRILIPQGFSNADVVYLDCPYTVTQPALVTSGPSPSCVNGPTTSGSIPAQTLDVNGDTETIDLSSYFTQGTVAIAGYTIYNVSTIVNASVSGSTLTLSSNISGGSTTVYVSAYDNSTNSCTATQAISVTVNAPGQTYACTNNGIAAISGGSIAQDGTITNPNSTGTITAIKDTSGGSPITSYSANNTGSDRSVTLYFDITAPGGYDNAGSTIECDLTFTQPSDLPTFDCNIANLNGQQISTKGVINSGSAQEGTISDWSPKSFDTVTSDTSRTVTFYITPPASGYTNSGGSDITCDKTITQPAATPTCGSNTLYISAPVSSPSNFCDQSYAVKSEIKSTGGLYGLGSVICRNNSVFDGGNFYYAVATSQVTVGPNYGAFIIWQIDSNGVIQDVRQSNCNGTGGDTVAL
jgi:hypothetical protein